jgi:branched-chain amino acid aminotransferase
MWSSVQRHVSERIESLEISVLDHGLTVGDGVFETIQTSNGKFLSLERHLKRLRESAQAVGLGVPNEAAIRDALNALRENLEFQSCSQGRLRITWTSGSGELGSLRGNGWSLVAVWNEAKPWSATSRLISSLVIKFSKSTLAQVKSTSYMENVIALNQAVAAGFDEAALFNENGFLAEGTSSNIFLLTGDQVLTPPLSAGGLGGITRQVLLEACPWISEKSITRDDMLQADLLFLTSSTRNLQPVSIFDSVSFKTSNTLFSTLIESYSNAIAKEWS